MALLIIITLICGGIGFWLATRYNLDGKAGLTLGMAFSILFNAGLYNEFRKYDPSMKFVLLIFATLLCLTFLLLMERRTLIACIKLAALTMIVSVLTHNAPLTNLYLRQVQSSITHAAGDPSGSFKSLIRTVQTQVASVSRRLTERTETLVEVRHNTQLVSADGIVSDDVEAGTWAVLGGGTIEEDNRRFAQVELLDNQGRVTQVGFVDEADIGLKVIVPPDKKNR